ncbi:MAG: hypothetical protein E7505_04510 [Ruminococcus sp.]|nr:hypothetical protein [Ruminococcus sp.]
MDIYKKRRLCALAVLLVLFVFMAFSIVRCSSKNKEKINDKETINQENSGEEVIVPNADPVEVEKPLQITKPSERVFSELSEIKFENVSLEPEDISLLDQRYLDNIVVVGDSISKGYSVYGRLNADNVLAVGSIGVRNVLETKFEYKGSSLGLLDILEKKKPKYIFVSLGMNDINIHSEEVFVENYKTLLEKIFEVSPYSKIIITAITPVTYGNSFTNNDKIDTYNETLRKMVYELNSDKVFFVNAAQYLKGDNNSLISELSSGDGIHLAAIAYDYLLTYMLIMLEWI